jgi:hypothetical protein
MNEEKTGDVTVPGVARITTMQQKGDELYFEAVTDAPSSPKKVLVNLPPPDIEGVARITLGWHDKEKSKSESNFTDKEKKLLEVQKQVLNSPEMRPILENIVTKIKEKVEVNKPKSEDKDVEKELYGVSCPIHGDWDTCEQETIKGTTRCPQCGSLLIYTPVNVVLARREGENKDFKDMEAGIDWGALAPSAIRYIDAINSEIDRLSKELAHIKMLKKATDDYTEGIQLTNYSKIITIDNQEYVIKKVKEENEALRVAKEDWHQVAHLNRIDMEQFQARVKELEILNYQMLEAHKQKDEAYDLLLKEYEKSVERVKELEVVMNGDIHCIEALRMENEALRVKVEELEKESSWAKTELKAVRPVLFEGPDRGG